MANNNCLLNQAIGGAFAGMLHGKAIAGITAGEITSMVAAAQAFAADVDAAVVAQATLSAAGLILAPTTDDIQQDETTAVTLMFGLCYAAWAGRPNPGATIAGTQTGLVAAVAAAWLAVYAVRTTP